MAGILAISASRPMTSAETTPNGSVAGYVVGEPIALSVLPAGAQVAWSLGTPTRSAKARSALSNASPVAAAFVPDVAGFYVVTAMVDSTTSYTAVLSATGPALASTLEAARMQATEPTAVPTPVAGAIVLFDSLPTKALTQKSENGAVTPIVRGVIGTILTDADETISVGAGVHRTLPNLTAARAKTLSAAGASVSDMIEIHRPTGTAVNTAAIVNGGPGGGTLFTFPAGELHSAMFRFDGTNWALWERRKLA